MTDTVSFTMDTRQFDEMAEGTVKANHKATMYAMRATGRYMVRIAKAKAPVYKGTDPRAMAESGNLRRSIANAKRLENAGETYTLKVGPFGTKKKGTLVTRTGKSRKEGGTGGQVRGVPLYRGQMEEMYGYMAAAINAGNSAAVKAIYDAAYDKAWAKWVAK